MRQKEIVNVCANCSRSVYAHGLCHRCWCREGLELDMPKQAATTPSVPLYGKQTHPWGRSEGKP